MSEPGRQKPGGTLASAADSNAVVEVAPDVTVARALRERARGVSPGVVIALVAGALTAGFLLGWALRGL
jgi:hypothetical protein